MVRGDKVGWTVTRLKNAERIAYFNPLARLGPSRITRSPCGPSAGRVDPHNFKM